jgi:hypothetical protein
MSETVQTSERAQLRPIRPDELPALKAAAAADLHEIIAPTHVVVKRLAGDEEIVGYASIGVIHVLNTWVCRGKVTARESVTLLRECETILKAKGAPVACLPVEPNSPFKPFVAKLGYTHFGWSGYNLKKLN